MIEGMNPCTGKDGEVCGSKDISCNHNNPGGELIDVVLKCNDCGKQTDIKVDIKTVIEGSSVKGYNNANPLPEA